jgi:hypothetical protein
VSIKHLNKAFEAKIQQSSLKFILVALADYANEVGEAYPTTETLCDKTALNRKTVLAGLTKLAELGFITDTFHRKGRTKQVRVWQINDTENGTLKASQKRNSTENGTIPKTDINDTENGTLKASQKRDIEPSIIITTNNHKKINKKEIVVLPNWVDKKLWSEWLSVRVKKKAVNSETALKALLNNLEQIMHSGRNPNSAIQTAIENSWKSIKLEWLDNLEGSNATRKPSSQLTGAAARSAEFHEDLKEFAARASC